MNNLIKVAMLIAIFVVSGCGDDQADQQKQTAKEKPAVPAAVTPASPAKTTVAPPAGESYPKPQWAILEQNVYYYP